MKPRRVQDGFTLLEVLVATTIMGIAVITLLTALHTSLRNADRLTDHDRMAMLARMRMDEVLVDDSLPFETDLQGRFDPAVTGGEEAGWRVTTSVYEAPPNATPGSPVLQRVALRVWWKMGDQQRTLDLEGFRRSRIPEQQP